MGGTDLEGTLAFMRIYRRPPWPIHLLALLALVAGCTAPDVGSSVVASGSSAPSASEEPSADPTAPPSAPTTSAPSEPPAALADGWTVVGSFGDDEGITIVNDVVRTDFGFLAGGVYIRTRQLNVFGPLPREGRVWRSADGTSWEDVTREGAFAESSVVQLLVLPDGTVVALTQTNVAIDSAPDDLFRAFTTADGGSTWAEFHLTVPREPRPSAVAVGGAGFLRASADDEGTPLLWHSLDGRTWQSIPSPTDGRAINAVAAGPEGFVLLASDTTTGETPMAFASADGVEWFEAASPAWDTFGGVRGLAPLGPDWIAVEPGPGLQDDGIDAETATWFSVNGLEWTEAGRLALRELPLPESGGCREFAEPPVSTGSLVIVPTTLSYPCAEGNVRGFGAAHITADGSTWTELPFTRRDVAYAESTRGTTINGGLDLPGGTLLVGEADYQATFWFRPSDD